VAVHTRVDNLTQVRESTMDVHGIRPDTPLFQLDITLLGCALPFTADELTAIVVDAGATLLMDLEDVRLTDDGLEARASQVRIASLAHDSPEDALCAN
jgi:hypothetical protein